MKWLKMEQVVFVLLIILLPTQLGWHFWPNWSYVNGIRVDYLSPTLFLTDILVLLLFVLTAVQVVQEKSKVRLGWLGGFGLLGAFILLNTAVSLSPAVTIYKWLKVVELGFLIWYIAQRDEIRNSKYVTLLLVPIFYESVLAFWQFWNQSSIGGIWYWLGERTFNSLTPGIANAFISGVLALRPYGTLPHPNALGGFLAVFLLLSIGYFPRISRKITAHFDRLNVKPFDPDIGKLVLGIGFAALLLSMSRVAIVGGLAGILIVLVKRLKWNRAMEWPAFAKASAGKLGVLGLLGLVLLWPRFGALGVESEPVVLREELNKTAVQQWARFPILGTGLGTSVLYPTRPSNYALRGQPPHNIYLLTLAEIGAVGLLGLLGLLSLALFKARQAGKWSVVVSLALISFIGLFDHYFLTLQQGQMMLALVFGLAFSRKGS